MRKKIVSVLLAGMMLAPALTGCTGTGTQQESAGQTGQSQEESLAPAESQVPAESTGAEEIQAGTPKYVFLFIGDGMSYPQVQLTNYYLSASQGQNAGTVTVEGEEKTKKKSLFSFFCRSKCLEIMASGQKERRPAHGFHVQMLRNLIDIPSFKYMWHGTV